MQQTDDSTFTVKDLIWGYNIETNHNRYIIVSYILTPKCLGNVHTCLHQ